MIVYSGWQHMLLGVNIKVSTDIKNDMIAILKKSQSGIAMQIYNRS